ncbi:MAG TPA: GNAT family N-acetyltransferase [Leptospiraceae bacterium]|nr:GNAT family N-acetyltransferase [Leptospirales bacterium]HMU85873.1 GNAT family N-acetyltransferase [Leptospiraceae bacterium]HMW58940.1 GNAT family N-acetyltransferase [Leptospiraceae bacterium]HMX55721.1 GNAT family N-acetyltransferase [Leptospiraceae bacterium]HMY44257.1 GNAT family N-acetyltransferase [Leptospiraceae bacterium]
MNLDDLSRLESLCFPDPWTREMLEGSVARPDSIVIFRKINEQISAYLLATSSENGIELLRIGVAPSGRRLGLAKSMIMELVAMSQRILLEVSDSNRAAISLYLGCGFKEIARRKRYYADGSDCIVMQLEKRSGF